VAVLDIDWPVYLDQVPARELDALFEDLASAATRTPEPEIEAGFLQQLEASLPEKRYEVLFEHVNSHVAGVMNFGADTPIDPNQGFFQIGMDSLMAVELRNRLQASTHCALPSTLAFDYPTVRLLSQYLAARLNAAPLEAASTQSSTADASSEEEELSRLESLSRDELKNLLDDELQSLDEG
jgi:acyl carrier protein